MYPSGAKDPFFEGLGETGEAKWSRSYMSVRVLAARVSSFGTCLLVVAIAFGPMSTCDPLHGRRSQAANRAPADRPWEKAKNLLRKTERKALCLLEDSVMQ